MFNSLRGRTVIVTGASKGIGRGIAERFGLAGCNVLVVARDLPNARLVADAIVAAGGVARAFSADVTRQSDMHGMAAAAQEAYGRIDILCANAGIFPPSPLATMTAEEFDLVMATNLKGTFLAVSACLPAMKQRASGRIVMTSSITGPITGYAGWSHYGASKAGQLGFMRTAAIELAPLRHHGQRSLAGQHRHRRSGQHGAGVRRDHGCGGTDAPPGIGGGRGQRCPVFRQRRGQLCHRAEPGHRWRTDTAGVAGGIGRVSSVRRPAEREDQISRASGFLTHSFKIA